MSDRWEVVTEHGPAVWRIAYRLLNHHADACEIYQDVFLAAFELERAAPVESWAGLLHTLATRRALDRLRQRYRSESRFVELEAVPDRPAPGRDPARGLMTAELLEHVRGALAQLPAKQAEVFWLSYVEECSHGEIGRRMEIGAGEVRVLLHRARSRLCAALERSPYLEKP